MRLPRINQKVTVRILQGAWEGIYATHVQEVDQQAITVAQPMFRGATLPLLVGEEVEVEFVDAGERLSFLTRVLGHPADAVPLVAVAVPAPGELRRQQQRDFVRLEVNLPLRYALIPEGAPPQGSRIQPNRPGRTLDVSGGGAQLVIQDLISEGGRLALLLRLEGADLAVEAEVVRISQLGPKEVRAGVRFTQITERDRERIVRYIFTEQRARRQKGLL